MEIFYWLRKIVLYKILRIQTHGVRIAVFDDDKVLLVRNRWHYLWVFPGGGIKKDELPVAAAARELFEETGIEVLKLNDKLKHFSVFENIRNGKNDIVHLFVTTFTSNYKSTNRENKNRNLLDFFEIAEFRWFLIRDLPKNISFSTKCRISEIINSNLPISKIW